MLFPALSASRARSWSRVQNGCFKLSPEEKHKTNYARVWDEKNQQVFTARAGTYTIVGDKLHQTPMIALATGQLGADRVQKIIRLDKDTMVTQTDDPPNWAIRRWKLPTAASTRPSLVPLCENLDF